MAEGSGRRDDDGGSAACDAGRVIVPVSNRGIGPVSSRVAACTAIVPAWRSEATLARTLRSLVVDNREMVERVIVVGCAGDDSARVAKRFPNVEVVALPERIGAGKARNLGRAYAPDARLLLFLDADCALAPHGAEALVDELETRGLDAAGAAIAGEGGGAAGWVRHLLEFKEAEPGVAVAEPSFLPSAALLVRADAFDEAGGFPDMWPGEDLVFGHRLRTAGRRIEKVETVIARHLHPPGVVALLRHQISLGATSAQARDLTGDMPGRGFVGRMWLVPVLLAGRTWRALAWIVRHRPRDLARFAALLPLYLAALGAWSAGFAAYRPQRRAQ